MRKPIRMAMLVGAAGVVVAGGTTAALAVQGNGQQAQPPASYSAAASPAARTDVSAGQARQIAQRLVPGGTITETELDHEHGRAVWEVDLTKNNREHEVRIDAATGQVIGVHHDIGTGDDH